MGWIRSGIRVRARRRMHARARRARRRRRRRPGPRDGGRDGQLAAKHRAARAKLRARFWPRSNTSMDIPSSHQQLMLMAAVTALLMPVTFPREVVPFDYAWRFRTVPPASPAPPPPPPWRKACPAFNATSSSTCSGLAATPAGNSSADLCRQQCCTNADCYVWQYSLVPASDRCWTGQCQTPGPDVPSWISQAAPVPSKPAPSPPVPPAPPGPAASGCAYCGVGVNDSTWELIDAPHDFIITQPISEAENNGAGSVSSFAAHL